MLTTSLLLFLLIAAVMAVRHELQLEEVVLHPIEVSQDVKLLNQDGAALTARLLVDYNLIKSSTEDRIPVGRMYLASAPVLSRPADADRPFSSRGRGSAPTSGSPIQRLTGAGSLSALPVLTEAPDLTIPNTGMSLQSVVRYLQKYSGREPKHISGRVFVLRGRPQLQMEVDGHLQDPVPFSPKQPDTAIMRGAEYVLRTLHPLVLAYYYYDAGKTAAARRAAYLCLERPPFDDDERAYNLLGLMLMDRNKYELAAEKFQMAIEAGRRHHTSWLGGSRYASPYINLGLISASRGQYPKGIAWYNKALGVDHHSALAYNNLGSALVDSHQYDAAIKAVKRATDLDVYHYTAYTIWARALAGKGDTAGAAAKYDEAVERSPRPAKQLTEWGDVFRSWGREADALAKYAAAVESDSSYAPAFLHWARLLSHQGRRAQAMGLFELAVRHDQKAAASSYIEWGDAFYELKEYRRALVKYRAASRADPNLAAAYHRWGLALDAMGDKSHAIRRLGDALKVDSTYTPALNALARMLIDKGESVAGVSEFVVSASIDSNVNALLSLGIVSENSDKLDSAAYYYALAARLHPQRGDAFRNWADVLAKVNNPDSAAALYAQAVTLDPTDTLALRSWGDLLLDAHDFKGAEQKYRSAIHIDTSYVEVYNNLALVLVRLGRSEEAKATYKAAIRLDPRIATAFLGLGDLLVDEGDTSTAKQLYQNAIRVGHNAPAANAARERLDSLEREA